MSTSGVKLGDLLFGRTRSMLLATLYDKPETPFFVRQLARHLQGSAGTIQRELATLVAAGLITRTVREHQVLYQANTSHPVFHDLRSLLAKSTGILAALGEALSPLQGRLECAFVYGSFARGEEHAESDVDLLTVGEVTLDDLLQAVAPLEKRVARPINPTVYGRGELREKLRAGNHFLKSLQTAPLIFLSGDEGDFRAIR